MWFIDIADTIETPIIQGIPLVDGADLLAQYRYLSNLPPGGLAVDTVATYSNLGMGGHLYYFVNGSPFEIPLTPQAQSFHISLSGVDYMLSVYWNTQI